MNKILHNWKGYENTLSIGFYNSSTNKPTKNKMFWVIISVGSLFVNDWILITKDFFKTLNEVFQVQTCHCFPFFFFFFWQVIRNQFTLMAGSDITKSRGLVNWNSGFTAAMVVAQISLSLLQCWHSLRMEEGTDDQLPRALFCFLNTRTARPNLKNPTQTVYPAFLKRAKRKMSQIKWGMSQGARELSWILVLQYL